MPERIPSWLEDFVEATKTAAEATKQQAEAARHHAETQQAQLRQHFEDVTARLLDQQQELQRRLSPAPSDAADVDSEPATSQPVPQPQLRPPAVQPPPKLSATTTLREFRAWRETWQDFAQLSELEKQPRPRQLALFRTCLSDDMRATLRHAIELQETDDTVERVLDRIGEFLRGQRNVALYRVRFEERRQHDGESFNSFLVALQELAADADFCTECLDARLATRIMSGIRSPEIRKKLLAMQPFPALDAVITECRSEESARSTEAELHSKQIQRAAQKPSAASRQSGAGTCRYCGGAKHKTRSDCPAHGTTCTKCLKRNHFAKVCESRQPAKRDKSAATGNRSGPRTGTAVHGIETADADYSSRRAPRVTVNVSTHPHRRALRARSAPRSCLQNCRARAGNS